MNNSKIMSPNQTTKQKPMTTETITQKLHAQADEALRTHVENIARPFFTLIGDINPHTFATKTEKDRSGLTVVYFREAWDNIVNLAVIVNRDDWRERYIREFMERLERLDVEISEIKNSL